MFDICLQVNLSFTFKCKKGRDSAIDYRNSHHESISGLHLLLRRNIATITPECSKNIIHRTHKTRQQHSRLKLQITQYYDTMTKKSAAIHSHDENRLRSLPICPA
jgi:predicted RNA-binding Zn-ribbon protein involved in translation (DUF1610 family)